MNIRSVMLAGVLVCGMAITAQARGSDRYVQVREGQLRERPSFLGPVTATVQYGDKLTLVRQQGPWQWVSVENREGWIHESALTRQRVVLTSGDVDVAAAASEQEMALAGKGFSAEVESEFRDQNQDIDFTWVNRMESWGIDTDRLVAFLREGGVNAP